MKLLSNSRFYILFGSLALSIFVTTNIFYTVVSQTTQLIRMEEIFGFASIILFYVSLIIGPFCYRFPKIPGNKNIYHARRAIGVSAFYFALLHTLITFFGQLGGFGGLLFLSGKYLLAIGTGFAALLIFAALTMTSFEFAIKNMGFKNWKFLHRFVYAAAILLLLHIVLLGTHYSDLSGTISQLSFFALALLLYFEAPRTDKWLAKKISLPKLGLGSTAIIVLLFFLYFTVVAPIFPNSGSPVSFDIHAAHRQLAEQAVQNQITNNTSQNTKAFQLPGLQGDRNLRYTVSWNNPQDVQSGQAVDLTFTVYDAQNGEPVSYFKTPYAKVMHLIIVNNDLTYFTHIHPTQDGYNFTITTTFPTDGMYHLYLDFQPWNAIEQQVAFTLPVGIPTNQNATQKPDKDKTTKTFGNYEVTLNTHGILSASEMTFGNQTLSFTIKDAQTHKPITTLKPYLATFGHLVMIDEATYTYLHVHPYVLSPAPLPPNANGVPTVDFLPIGIYGPIKPGVYRLFAEFNPDNNLFTADFTVKVGE